MKIPALPGMGAALLAAQCTLAAQCALADPTPAPPPVPGLEDAMASLNAPSVRLAAQVALVAPLAEGGLETRDIRGGLPVVLAADERLLVSARAEPPAHLWLLYRGPEGDFEVLGSATPNESPAILLGPPGWPISPLAGADGAILVVAAVSPPAALLGRKGAIGCGRLTASPDPACAMLRRLSRMALSETPEAPARLAAGSVRSAEGRAFPGVVVRAVAATSLTALALRLKRSPTPAP